MYVQCLISMVIFFTYDNLCISAKNVSLYRTFLCDTGKYKLLSYYKTFIEKKKNPKLYNDTF